jgi:cytoskeletal protein RodZ
MNNYCGMCGFSLDETALRAGRCPHCGAPIDSRDDVADIPTRPDAILADVPAQSPPYVAAAGFEAAGTRAESSDTLPERQESRLQEDIGRNRGRRSRRRRRPRGVSRIWQFAFLALVLFLLADLAVYALTQRNPLSVVVSPFTSSSASASSDASSISSAGSTATASGTSTAAATSQTPARTLPPGGATGPSGSPTQSAASAPTATPVPPTLSVSPTTFTLTTCPPVIDKPQFTVANTGGTPMSWSASAGGSGYAITPSSGSIDPGEHETVKVSNILRSGTVTITAPNAHDSPQQVRITCTV